MELPCSTHNPKPSPFEKAASRNAGSLFILSAGRDGATSVHFYNIYGNPVNPPDGVDAIHGEQAFRNSMIANGFKLIS